jgi:hypothetical protein
MQPGSKKGRGKRKRLQTFSKESIFTYRCSHRRQTPRAPPSTIYLTTQVVVLRVVFGAGIMPRRSRCTGICNITLISHYIMGRPRWLVVVPPPSFENLAQNSGSHCSFQLSLPAELHAHWENCILLNCGSSVEHAQVLFRAGYSGSLVMKYDCMPSLAYATSIAQAPRAAQ